MHEWALLTQVEGQVLRVRFGCVARSLRRVRHPSIVLEDQTHRLVAN